MSLRAHITQATIYCLLLSICVSTVIARIDNNWIHRRSKVLVTHHRPAGVRSIGVVNNQTQWQRNNLTLNQSYNNFYQQQNNRTPINQSAFRPNITNSQTPKYNQATFNQSRPSWPQSQTPSQAQYSAYRQQIKYNQTHPPVTNPAQYPVYGTNAFFNQTRPLAVNYPYYSPGSLNQTRPSSSQPIASKPSNVSQNPLNRQQGTYNQTLPVWSQPTAPQLPSNLAQPMNSNAANLYPKLPNFNMPQNPSSSRNNSTPLSPLNWHSGGPTMLSYGPGYYPAPAGNSQKKVPTHQGSSNPYANIFN